MSENRPSDGSYEAGIIDFLKRKLHRLALKRSASATSGVVSLDESNASFEKSQNGRGLVMKPEYLYLMHRLRAAEQLTDTTLMTEQAVVVQATADSMEIWSEAREFAYRHNFGKFNGFLARYDLASKTIVEGHRTNPDDLKNWRPGAVPNIGRGFVFVVVDDRTSKATVAMDFDNLSDLAFIKNNTPDIKRNLSEHYAPNPFYFTYK